VKHEGRYFQFYFLWDPGLLFDVGSELIAVMFGAEDKLQLLGHDGKSMGTIKVKGFPRPPLDPAQVAEEFDNGYLVDMPKEVVSVIKQKQPLPKFWPNVLSLLVDDRNQVWLFGSAQPSDGAHPFVVMDRKGATLGSGRVPALPAQVRDNRLYYLGLGIGEQEGDRILEVQQFRP